MAFGTDQAIATKQRARGRFTSVTDTGEARAAFVSRAAAGALSGAGWSDDAVLGARIETRLNVVVVEVSTFFSAPVVGRILKVDSAPAEIANVVGEVKARTEGARAPNGAVFVSLLGQVATGFSVSHEPAGTEKIRNREVAFDWSGVGGIFSEI